MTYFTLFIEENISLFKDRLKFTDATNIFISKRNPKESLEFKCGIPKESLEFKCGIVAVTHGIKSCFIMSMTCKMPTNLKRYSSIESTK